MVARGAGAAGPVLLACRQWDPLGLAQRLPSLGAWAWRSAPLLPWRVQCPVRVCAALAAGSGGSGRYLVLCLFRFPLAAPRVPRCVWRAVSSGFPLPSLTGTPFHAVCAFRELGQVALLVVPACPLLVCALALPRRPLPSPLGGVACAPRAVPAQGAGRAFPRGPCPSACPAPVPCSVWRAWGGGGAVQFRFPPTWLGLHALWGLRAAGLVGGRPRGGGGLPLLCRASGVRRCPSPERPSSGVGSRGTATRVFRVRSVWAWGPSTGSTACALAGWRCALWGWRKGVPGGGAFHRCEGRLRSGAPPPPTARPLGGLFESATHVLWARVCGCGGPTLSPWPACPVGAACRGGGRGPSPGGVACHCCQGRLVSGAVPPPAVCPLGRVAGVPRPVCPWVRSVRAWGPSTGLTACALARRHCSLWGWRKGVPGGGVFQRCEGRLRSGAPPPPTARPLGGLLGSATHVLWARVCGCGGPTLSPWPACPVGAACCGAGGGPSQGVLACHRCEGRLVSGAVPPPAARPLGRAARVPQPVCLGCGRCGRGDPAPAPRRAPLRAGVARCGGGGRASPGGVPSTVVRGV